MFFSTMPAVSPTFARVGSVSITVASEALGQGAVLNEELTVLKLPIVEQALLHQSVSFHGGSHLQEEGPMCLATLQRLYTPGNTKDFDSRLQGRVLGLDI
jgi:hypothetical protein